ncbi:lipocalin family protein [Pontibacter sp. SGAir0037]|uniref:lipocalin family protein n=1 Tax=Pontibacter sp. SGAir0037 TaxID=2571030 RepID=UPI001F0D0664|nr:lipocalin family protein [Pontibacter sp. SGAir0037]
MKRIVNAWQFLLVAFVLVVSSCGNNEKVGDQQMISGSGSKTWKASKELNASGDKEKLSSAEQEETMQFYSDGRFALGGGGTLETGTWTFDQAAKRLSLQFQDQSVTENFEVVQLTEKEMRLKDNQGGEMQLKAQ